MTTKFEMSEIELLRGSVENLHSKVDTLVNRENKVLISILEAFLDTFDCDWREEAVSSEFAKKANKVLKDAKRFVKSTERRRIEQENK
jgi:hypothetical protein